MIYLNMAIGSAHGWGLCGKHIALELARLEPLRIVAEPLDAAAVGDPLEYHVLRGLLLPAAKLGVLASSNGPRVLDGPLLQGIGSETLVPRDRSVCGTPTVGYTFFENNLLRSEWVENGRRYFDRIVAGSTWCARTLAEVGLPGVATAIQGVDTALFHPRGILEGCREFLGDKFVVFSGGKFEFRKGQDIVIRAYKVLQDRHEDVILVNAWHNPWPAVFQSMRRSPLIRFSPGDGRWEEMVSRVLADNGIDLERVITCSRQLNSAMARIYHNTDVGLFPNRCEGGTNLVLMEYMACGKPVIATDTTGHADIVNRSNALVIAAKGETTLHDDEGAAVARWPEPDLDDAIDKLEWAYQNRGKLRELGHQAGADLAKLTWRRTAQAFAGIMRGAAGDEIAV
jgi:glycosyltransferase involved in cell wall biosynthesis